MPQLFLRRSALLRSRAFLCAFAAVTACGRGSDDGPLTKGTLAGPDPLVVRVARKGGKARAYRYPALDSAVWTSAQNVPAVSSLMAFDHENGLVAYADSSGMAGWIDLRLGSVRPATRKRVTLPATADGWSIFGISGKSDIVRFTPAGDWTLSVKNRVISDLLPQEDGTLLVLFDAGDSKTLVMRLRPPDSRWLDSLEMDRPDHVARTDVGDRVYFSVGRRLQAVSTANLREAANLRISGEIAALAPTPSGDRIYVVTQSDVIDVYDRYSNEVIARVQVPGVVAELRMDGFGRYLLGRSALGDTTWVISTGSNRFVGAVAGTWRADLPAVGADGAIATVRGADVVFVDPTNLQEVGRAKGAANDVWYFMQWNGFRPRAQGIDQPVQFSWRGQDSAMAVALGDTGRVSLIGGAADSARRAAATAATAAAAAAATRLDSVRTPPPPTSTSWTVSFAVFLAEERARSAASEIVVEGERAHVVPGKSGETNVFRVVLGPFRTRADAERVGKASGRQYWVYDGVP